MSQRRRDRARVREERIVLLSRLSAVSPSADESPRRPRLLLALEPGAGVDASYCSSRCRGGEFQVRRPLDMLLEDIGGVARWSHDRRRYTCTAVRGSLGFGRVEETVTGALANHSVRAPAELGSRKL